MPKSAPLFSVTWYNWMETEHVAWVHIMIIFASFVSRVLSPKEIHMVETLKKIGPSYCII